MIHVPWPTRSERLRIAQRVYDDLRRGDRWGQRFQATLPEKSAQMLANLPGSIRHMQSMLRLAFAYALDRKSRAIEVLDLEQVLLSELPPSGSRRLVARGICVMFYAAYSMPCELCWASQRSAQPIALQQQTAGP